MKHCLPHILTVALGAAVRERGGEPPEELEQAGELGLLRDDQVRHGLQPPRLQGLRLLLRLPRIRGHRRPHRQVNMFKLFKGVSYYADRCTYSAQAFNEGIMCHAIISIK